MPLTPAEVHNVAFKKPPIGKRGYDEEEVDAFLDIVEVELSRLIEENNDLKARSSSGAPAPVAAVQGSAPSGADPAELASARRDHAASTEENQRLKNQVAELERAMTQGKDQTQAQLVAVQQQLAQTEQQLNQSRQQLQQAQQAAQAAQAQAAQAAQAAAAQQKSPQNAAAASAAPSPEHHAQAVQMLALAQQTADNHLAQSRAEAERLVNEANTNAQASLTDAQSRSEKHLSEAQARAEQLDKESTSRATQTVQDAEQRAATITAQFEQRKAALERRVEELRTFEREYRTRLKSYLESQLRDLDASGRAEPAASGQNNEYADAQKG